MLGELLLMPTKDIDIDAQDWPEGWSYLWLEGWGNLGCLIWLRSSTEGPTTVEDAEKSLADGTGWEHAARFAAWGDAEHAAKFARRLIKMSEDSFVGDWREHQVAVLAMMKRCDSFRVAWASLPRETYG